MKRMISLTGGMLLLTAGAALAQDAQPNCKDPQTQADMTQCAGLAAEKADKALNAQYKKTRASQVAFDADSSDDMKGAEKALIAAQRAWIAFRDSQCISEGFQAHGGTMEPMLIAACTERMTIARTEELKALEKGLGN